MELDAALARLPVVAPRLVLEVTALVATMGGGALSLVAREEGDGPLVVRGFRIEPGQVEIVSVPPLLRLMLCPAEHTGHGRPMFFDVTGYAPPEGAPPDTVLERFAALPAWAVAQLVSVSAPVATSDGSVILLEIGDATSAAN